MDSIPSVMVRIEQIQLCRISEIAVCLFSSAQTGGHDAENTRRQRGIVRCDLLIVVERLLHGLPGLHVLKQYVGQNRVRLLAHLMAV